jgi:hypothetical protein
LSSQGGFIEPVLVTAAAASATASATITTATAAPKTVRAAKTIKTVKAAEAEKEKAAKTTAISTAKTAALPCLIHIVLVLIPRNRLVRMEITNIQHLKISLEIIHVHTSVFFNKLCQQHERGHNEEHQKSTVMNPSILRRLSSSKYVLRWGIVTESNTHIYPRFI